MNKLLRLSTIVILLVLLIDQSVKFIVKTNMFLGQDIHVIGNWFILHFTENNGMAFGMQFAGSYGKLFLSLIRVLAIAAIGWYLVSLTKKRSKKGLIIAISLVFAGALGNIIDSAFYGMIFTDSTYQIASFLPEQGGYSTFLHGKVVDMFYFPIIKGVYPSWFPFWANEEFIFFRPVFNIADSAITVGVFMLILFQRRYFSKK